jgi:RNA recognition motif-containing protein
MLEDTLVQDSSKQYKIYVGSIPGYIESKDILNYFEKFGSVSRVRMFYSEPHSKVNKGYCHLITSDQGTYQKILDYPHHVMEDRRLYCCAYISGRKLRSHNIQSNSKRVVVRNIPQYLTGPELKSLFERFGQVEMAYIFTPHGLMQKPADQNQTGSVQFKDARVAVELVKKKNLYIRTRQRAHCFMIYPFIHNYNNFKSIQKDIEILYQDDGSMAEESEPGSQPLEGQGQQAYQRKCLLAKRVQATVPYHQIRPTSSAYFRQLALIRELMLVPERDIRLNQQQGSAVRRQRIDFQSSNGKQPSDGTERERHCIPPQTEVLKDRLAIAERPEAQCALRPQTPMMSFSASLTNSTLTERSRHSGSENVHFCAIPLEPTNARIKTAEKLINLADRPFESCEASSELTPALSQGNSRPTFISQTLLISTHL